MIRPHAQDESIHALHAKARARMQMLAQGLRVVSFASHACVACVRCLSLAPSRTLLTNLYIVNPEPESLKPKDYARIR